MREPGWITKAEAAQLLDVDERTIERRARAGRIGARAKPGFPTLYRQADVEILKQTSPGEVRTGILEVGPAGNGNGSGAVAHRRDGSSTFESRLADLLQVLIATLTHAPIGPTGPTDGPTGPTRETSFLTITEASAFTGLTQAFLKRMIAQGTLTAIKDRGWKIRRKDLEAL